MKLKKLALGKKGEDIAVKYLKKKGYEILDKNYKTSIGEIDIIAKDKDIIVFIEVKTRITKRFGEPFESITKEKKYRIFKIALFYLTKNKNLSHLQIRFDVISILFKNQYYIKHIIDAFRL